MLPPFRLLQETLPSLVRKFLCFHWATQSSETRKSAWGAEQGRQGQGWAASRRAVPCLASEDVRLLHGFADSSEHGH